MPKHISEKKQDLSLTEIKSTPFFFVTTTIVVAVYCCYYNHGLLSMIVIIVIAASWIKISHISCYCITILLLIMCKRKAMSWIHRFFTINLFL